MFAFYILLFWILLALLEIEIEGEHGWAKHLPTWRKKRDHAPIWFLRNITGYHTILFLMILFLNHIVYIGFFWWTDFVDEMTILAFHLFLIIYWDFLWFVLNPHFTYKKFRKEHISWYTDSEWFVGFPMDYWYALGLSGILVWFSFLIGGNTPMVEQFLISCLGGWLIWISLIFTSPLYHRWYHFMRR